MNSTTNKSFHLALIRSTLDWSSYSGHDDLDKLTQLWTPKDLSGREIIVESLLGFDSPTIQQMLVAGQNVTLSNIIMQDYHWYLKLRDHEIYMLCSW